MSNTDDPGSWGPAPEPGGGTTPPPPPPPPSSEPFGTPPPPPQGGWGQQPGGQGWQQPPQQGWGGYGYAQPAQTENSAIVALVLSCASWVVCPVILAIVALAMVPSARTKIRESQGRLTGESLLTATKVIAWLNIGLLGLVVGFVILIAVLGAATSSTGY